MSLTDAEITPGGSYTVRFEYGHLSPKRFGDAVKLVKGINGQRDSYFYDPENPSALKTGMVANDDPAVSTSAYDAGAKTWTVTVPPKNSVSALRTLASAYDAIVERA